MTTPIANESSSNPSPGSAREKTAARPAPTEAERRERRLAAGFSLALTLLVLSPILQNWRDDPIDGFPLSHYPMFTTVRGETTKITFVEAVDRAGVGSYVRYSHAGPGGFNQVRRQIKRLVRQDRAAELCALIASRLARRDRYRDTATVRLVTGEFHIQDYMHGAKQAVSRQVRASCGMEDRR